MEVDKRTKEYRDGQVMEAVEKKLKKNYDVCNDPHGIGCAAELPGLDSGSPRVASQAAPCSSCVNRNLHKYVGADGVVRDKA